MKITKDMLIETFIERNIEKNIENVQRGGYDAKTVDKLLKFANMDVTEENKKELQKSLYELNLHIKNEQIGGESYVSAILFRENVGTFGKILDILQLTIDILGSVPLPPPFTVGPMALDAGGVVLSLMRKDISGAFFSAINIIPIIGPFMGNPLKYGGKILKAQKRVKKAMKVYNTIQNVRSVI